LALWNRAMRRVVENGAFEIMIGSSSEDIRLRGRLNLTGMPENEMTSRLLL